jgi:hypothetical protein
MFTNPAPLFSVKGTPGAHIVVDQRVTGFGPQPHVNIVDVKLIGADLPYSVPLADVHEFTQADRMTEGDPITLLAQEAVLLFGADPARVIRAAELARDPHKVQQAGKDESGETIKKSLNVFIVAGSSGWYVVRPGSCTCEDHKRGHVCKHRLAAWMHRENIVRSLAQVRKVAPAVVLAELVAQ